MKKCSYVSFKNQTREETMKRAKVRQTIQPANQGLYEHNKAFLEKIHADQDKALTATLAMLVTGLFLGRHVQFWSIALWLPFDIQLTSLVRRFERFVADPRIEARKWFKPFVEAMYLSFGNETQYLIIDSTQAGSQCRTLMAAITYHQTVLPVGWKTYKGKKGHLKGEQHRALLESVQPYLRYAKRVIVLGDAEFSSEPVIAWLLDKQWDFVLRFQNRYQVQLTAAGEWQSMKAIYEAADLKAGQTLHWEQVGYTQSHQLPDLTVTVQWGKEHDEPICLVSSLPAAELPEQVYERRYWIETLFGNHKSRGFQLARTHLTDPEHIDRLLLAIAIATCFTLGLGTHLIIIKQTHLVDRTDRRDLSLFQLGFRWLFRLLALNRLHEFKIIFRWDFTLPPAGFQKT
jgi:hypothetical protein